MKNGFALIDKPTGITSHDVVNQIRRLVGTKKVGHAGTLDPFASGLLILGVNRATRLLGFLLGLDKSYRATMRLGEARDTDDLTGTVISSASTKHLTESVIRTTLAAHTGTRMQMPSTFSAKKVGGQKAYELARRGLDVSLNPKEITIYGLDVVKITLTPDAIDIEFDVTCSSGTYIRAIARDVGNELGVGAHLRALRRIAIGDFLLQSAQSVEDFVLHPVAEICQKIMPTHQVETDTMTRIRYGKPLALDIEHGVSALLFEGEVVAVVEKVEGIISYKAVLVDT